MPYPERVQPKRRSLCAMSDVLKRKDLGIEAVQGLLVSSLAAGVGDSCVPDQDCLSLNNKRLAHQQASQSDVAPERWVGILKLGGLQL